MDVPLSLYNSIFVSTLLLYQECHKLHSIYPSWFDHSYYIWWEVLWYVLSTLEIISLLQRSAGILRCNPEGLGFDSRWCEPFRLHYDSACSRNEYQEYFLGGKAKGRQHYHLHVPTVMKSVSLNPWKPQGLSRDWFTLLRGVNNVFWEIQWRLNCAACVLVLVLERNTWKLCCMYISTSTG